MTDIQEPTYDQAFERAVAEREGTPAEQVEKPAEPVEATAETKPPEVETPKAEDPKPDQKPEASAVDLQELERLRQYERSNEGRIAAFQREQEATRRELDKLRKEAEESRRQKEQAAVSETLGSIEKDYPELATVLKKMTGEDLKAAIKQIVAEEVTPLKQTVAPLVERTARQSEDEARRFLNEKHPGWIELVRSDEYRKWLAEQPSAIREMNSSPDAASAARLLDIYKKDVGLIAQPKPDPKADRLKELERSQLLPSRQARDENAGTYDHEFARWANKIESGMRAH